MVADEDGFQRYGEPRRFTPTVDVHLSMVTDLDGIETEAAVVFVDGRELALGQALALAAEIRRQVNLYRATGGRA